MKTESKSTVKKVVLISNAPQPSSLLRSVMFIDRNITKPSAVRKHISSRAMNISLLRSKERSNERWFLKRTINQFSDRSHSFRQASWASPLGTRSPKRAMASTDQQNSSLRRSVMFIDPDVTKTCAVRRSGTQLERYRSRHIPLLRTAPEWHWLASYKHLTPP